MPLLQAFLALALTMLSLSTMATVGVEIVNRVLHLRGKDLKRMLTIFYETELQQLVTTHFRLDSLDKIDAMREDVIARLTSNPLVPDPSQWRWSWLRDLTNLSTAEMVKRLPKTAVGQALAARTASDVDFLLDNTIAKYDQYGKAASDLFKRRSQVISIAAGIVVAFMLNVDALFTLQTYVQDPIARQTVIAHAETIISNWEQVNDRTTQRTAGEHTPQPASANNRTQPTPLPEDAHPADDSSHPASANTQPTPGIAPDDEAPAASPQDGSPPAATPPGASADLQNIKSDLAQIQGLAKELQDYVGVPLGYHPSLPPLSLLRPVDNGGNPQTAGGDQVSTTPGRWRRASDLLIWFLRVLGSGLLIGLGGPFWFNIVQSLMHLISGKTQPPAAAAATQAATAGDGTPADPNAELKHTFASLQKAAQLLAQDTDDDDGDDAVGAEDKIQPNGGTT